MGRSAPFPARPRAGARLSLKESRRKEHQGGERFSPPWTHLSLVCDQREVFSMFRDWPAAHEPTPVTARPPAGRAGRGWFCRREGKHSAKPSPWGEGAPVRTLGRMRGRPGCPTGQEKKGVGATGPSFYKERLGTGSPPHPSPSVTASPQGEAFVGATPPQRNSFLRDPCSRKMRIQIRARTWVP